MAETTGEQHRYYEIIPQRNADGTQRDLDEAIAEMARASEALSVSIVMAMLDAEGWTFAYYRRPADAPDTLMNKTGLSVGVHVCDHCWVSGWDARLLYEAWEDRILDEMRAQHHQGRARAG